VYARSPVCVGVCECVGGVCGGVCVCGGAGVFVWVVSGR
jgi:hypothetical protein